MKRLLSGLLLFLLVAGAALALPLKSRAADRWLHIRVESTGKGGEHVRVNIPLKVAEKVLPAISADELRDGRLRIRHARVHGVDLRALLEAVRDLDDGEFVTVQSDEENVRVAKKAGYLIVKVDEHKGKDKGGRVDVKIPFRVVEALLSGEKDELNLLAAVQALSESPDDTLVTVNDENEQVRIWVDSIAEAE